LLKNTLYRDRNLYKKKTVNGRLYWGDGDYCCEDFDASNIKLSGMNWLSTVNYKHLDKMQSFSKEYDVAALFQYPLEKEITEHNINQTKHYNEYRKRCIDVLNNSDLNINVIQLEYGKPYGRGRYYELMAKSKIIIAPFGFGEIAPRDIDSAYLDSILIKPDMSHIETIPNIFDENVTYFPCNHNFSNLEEVIENALFVYESGEYPDRLKEYFLKEIDVTKLVMHIYEILLNLDIIQ